MKLWIDDFRKPPDDSWTWVTNLQDAITTWITEGPETISFDHDLGVLISLDKPLNLWETTMPLAQMIEEAASKGTPPPVWTVHSMNPVGAKNLKACLSNADRLYKEYLDGIRPGGDGTPL